MSLPQVRRRVDASVAEQKAGTNSTPDLIPKALFESGLAGRDDGGATRGEVVAIAKSVRPLVADQRCQVAAVRLLRRFRRIRVASQ